MLSAGISFGEGGSAGISFREARPVGNAFREARQTRFRQNRPRQTENQQIHPRQTGFRLHSPRQTENRQTLPRQTGFRQEPPPPDAKAPEAWQPAREKRLYWSVLTPSTDDVPHMVPRRSEDCLGTAHARSTGSERTSALWVLYTAWRAGRNRAS